MLPHFGCAWRGVAWMLTGVFASFFTQNNLLVTQSLKNKVGLLCGKRFISTSIPSKIYTITKTYS